MGCLDSDLGNSVFGSANWKTLKAILAEFMGTAIFIMIGLASCLNWNHTTDHDALIRIGLTFGLGITGVIYAFGPISGAHVNPAVTIACMLAGRTKVIAGLLYIIAQCTGAICGAGLLYMLQQEDMIGQKNHQFGVTKVNPLLRTDQGLFIEMVTAMIFILVILLVTHDTWADSTNGTVAIAIGFTLTSIILGFGNAAGGSLNPARSLGPAFIMMDFGGLWLYWLAPIAGSILAVLFYKIFTWEPTPKAATTDNDAQTSALGPNGNENAVFVSSDLNSATSYDEIVIEDDSTRRK